MFIGLFVITSLTDDKQPSEVTSAYVSPDSFEYTVEGGRKKLTLEQRKFYEDNGFLVIKNLVDKKELEKYRYSSTSS